MGVRDWRSPFVEIRFQIRQHRLRSVLGKPTRTFNRVKTMNAILPSLFSFGTRPTLPANHPSVVATPLNHYERRTETTPQPFCMSSAKTFVFRLKLGMRLGHHPFATTMADKECC